MKVNKNNVNDWLMYVATDWGEIHLAKAWEADRWEDAEDFVNNMLLKLRFVLNPDELKIEGLNVLTYSSWDKYREHATDVFLVADQDDGTYFAGWFRNEHFNGRPKGSWSMVNLSEFSWKQRDDLYNALNDSWHAPKKAGADLKAAFHDVFNRDDKEVNDGCE